MNEQTAHYDLIVIGSGPAGFTAAIYGARGGAATALFGGVAPGGQLLLTTEIENYPGFPVPVAGADLMQNMVAQASRLGTKVFNEEISSVDFSLRPFKLVSDSGKVYTASAVIAATGARARWLGLPSEHKYIGRGVSGCATCDGFFYRRKEVCVIGGGDSAAEEALFLTKFASRVYIVHRRDKLRANFRLQEKLRANPKAELVYNHVLDEVTGGDKVSGVVLKDVNTGKLRRLETPGVFIAIGHSPATKIFEGKLNLDEAGYIITDHKLGASVYGVFAAGDVMDTRYKQAAAAVGAGCRAAMEALVYLEEIKK